MALLDFPSTQSVNIFIENVESFKRVLPILHNSFPDIGDDTVEPGKVSHCEEIYNERQCKTTVHNDINWCFYLHNSKKEEKYRQID